MENKIKNHKCQQAGINESKIITVSKFGHGDSTHTTYIQCEVCGRKSKEFGGWDLFSHESVRDAQVDWNNSDWVLRWDSENKKFV